MSSDRPSLPATLAFRFATVYFILYSTYGLAPGLLGFGWHPLMDWVGGNVFGIEGSISFSSNGSGDTTADYVRLFVFVVVAILACGAWTAVDRGRTTHPRVAAWLTVGARYWLGMIMISYGVAKVFPGQFPSPDFVRLGDTYGESSPMGLLWTFMGHSPVYSAFAGGAEVLGGVLLFWRRTTTLGALICIGVLVNIVMLNFSYDVPVKLFSSHLLVVALVLAGQDAQRLFGVLVTGRAVPARTTPPITTSPRGHRIGWTLKCLFLGALTVMMVLDVLRGRAWHAAAAPLEGVYDVVAHELECDLGRECGDEMRWHRVVVGRHRNLALEPLQGPRTKYRVDIDEPSELFLFPEDDGPFLRLDFHEPAEGALILEGSFGGAKHRITLQRVDEPDFLLVNRGFHWINEYPFGG